MNRARKKNKGLPKRVYVKNGAYHFVAAEQIRDPADGKLKKWVKLCRVDDGETQMLIALSTLLKDRKLDQGSMPYVCTEFGARKMDEYGKDTQAQYRQYLTVISAAFEDFHVGEVTTKDCADFLRKRFSGTPNTAQKYTRLMRKLFKYVISELGLRQDNPVDQLDTSNYRTKRRTALPTHDQIEKIRSAGMISKSRSDTGKALANQSGPMFCCIIDMAYLCWARAIDVRMLRETQIDGDWIRFKASKTSQTSGKVVDIFITPQIRSVIDEARRIKRSMKIKGQDMISPFLFPTRKGTPYSKSGLYSMFDRARERAEIEADVQFKDLRALGATDAARSGQAMEEIRKRLTHTTTKTSEIYVKEAIPERSEIDLVLPWKTV